jgi:hypothetical protein
MLRSPKTGEPVANRLLAALPGKEYQRLRPHLEEVTLSFGEVLYESGEIIRRVYFPNQRKFAAPVCKSPPDRPVFILFIPSLTCQRARHMPLKL